MYKVLFVDDDNITRCVCSNMKSWEKFGFMVEYEAENGIKALEILKANKVDVVFTDIRMPEMDGIALLKEIRRQKIDVFVVLVSLYKEFEYAREGLKYGAVDYIMKPIEEKALDETLSGVRSCLDEFNMNAEYKRIIDEKFNELGPEGNDAFIINLKNILAQNPESNLSMDEFAKYLGFSKDYFGKMVKQKTGVSFNKLLTSIKMQYSKTLLASGKYKVYEVSDMLGYSEPDYFTRIFKAEFGVSPNEFRKALIFNVK